MRVWTENGQLHGHVLRHLLYLYLSCSITLIHDCPIFYFPIIALFSVTLATNSGRLTNSPSTYDPSQPYHLIIHCPTTVNQPTALIVKRSISLAQPYTEEIASSAAPGGGWPSSDIVHDCTSPTACRRLLTACITPSAPQRGLFYSTPRLR